MIEYWQRRGGKYVSVPAGYTVERRGRHRYELFYKSSVAAYLLWHGTGFAECFRVAEIYDIVHEGRHWMHSEHHLGSW